MNLSNFNFSNLIMFKFLFWGVILFVVLRVIRTYIPFLLRKRKYRKITDKLLPVAELTIWLLFFSWILKIFLASNQILAIGVLILLLLITFWITKYSLKDMIAGVILKSSGRLMRNETVKINDHTGKIITFRLLSLELETEQGKIIFIPYSKIITEISIKSHQDDLHTSHTFTLKIPKKMSNTESIDKIKQSIYNLPWSSIKKEPMIKTIEESNMSSTVEITMYSVETEFLYKIEKYVREKYGEQKHI